MPIGRLPKRTALVGIDGITWALPHTDAAALLVSAALCLPYLKKVAKEQKRLEKPEENA